MVLSKTLSATCGWGVEGLWVGCGAAPCPPHHPGVAGEGLAMRSSSWSSGLLSRIWAQKITGSGSIPTFPEHKSDVRPPSPCLETAVGRWRGCQRNLLWKHETFRCEFSSPSCPCHLWLDSQGGMCPLVFRPVYLTLNNTTQLTICEMKTPEGQTLASHSALEATQGICVLSQPPN